VPFVAPRPEEELYDLAADPHEARNVASDPAYAVRLAAMRERLERWQSETQDAAPAERRPDGFDRETGERLDAPRGRRETRGRGMDRAARKP
jgi:hypothetical protein